MTIADHAIRARNRRGVCYNRAMADRTSSPLPDPSPACLHREVLPPQKQESGFGVVVVAALAMFMAVASSALVVRARIAKTSCASHEAPAPVVPAATFTIPVAEFDPGASLDPVAERECGKPYYLQNGDGSVSVYFEACVPDEADPAWGIRGLEIAPSIVVEISETP